MNIEHEWTLIEIEGKPVLVSRDAVKVDGVRRRFTYEEACVMAFQLGGRLPTCAELDARFEQADLQNKPHTQRLWEGEDDSDLHSQLIDADIEAHGSVPNIVGVAGKAWVQPEAGDEGKFPLYGWHLDSPYKTWKGIKLHGPKSDETLGKVIQPYSPTAHNKKHSDYSMTGVFACDDTGVSRETNTNETPPPESDEVVELVSDPPPDTLPAPAISSLDIVFKQAHDYQVGRPKGPPIWICIHTAECAESSKAAENLQSWAKGDINASWHYAVDDDSITQSVKDMDRAWAVGSNPSHDLSIHIELAGSALQTVEQWHDTFSTSTLKLAAKLCAEKATEFSIPVDHVGPAKMRSRIPGFHGHVDVTKGVGKGKTSHYDPGKNFPWREFLLMVRSEM